MGGGQRGGGEGGIKGGRKRRGWLVNGRGEWGVGGGRKRGREGSSSVKLVLTPSCLRRGAGGDRDSRRWGKRETVHIALHRHHQTMFLLENGQQ